MDVVMKKSLSALVLLLALAGSAIAGNSASTGGSARPDPFQIPDISTIMNASVCSSTFMCNAPNADTATKTARTQTVNNGVRNLIILVAGQSNNEPEAPSAYTPTNPTVIDNFNYLDGSMYAAADPVLGASRNGTGPGLMDLRVADQLITGGKFDRVILVPMAIGGSAGFDWGMAPGTYVPTGQPSGHLSNIPCIAMQRLAARGIVPGTNVTFIMDWGQGESEQGLSTTQIQYAAYLTYIATQLDSCGFVGRMFVNVMTWVGGPQYAPVAAAQTAFAGTVIGNVTAFIGGNLDSLNNTFRVDNTHFNDSGAASGATLKFNAWHASGAPF
jgi:hypothetical protein